MSYTLPDGVVSKTIDTDRLKIHYLETGRDDGEPVVFLHGNLASALFWDNTLAAMPAQYRGLAVDMRGFGGSDPVTIDATRGMGDFADDLDGFIAGLGLDGPVHLVGWSTGGGAILRYAIDHPNRVRSLTLVSPVSPYGFGGTKDVEGTPTFEDFAGSGAGIIAPEMIERLQAGDMGTESDLSPRSFMKGFYWKPTYELDSDREDALVAEILKTSTATDVFPGDVATSENWPGVAPGTTGVNNALSGKYSDVTGFSGIDPKPPVLWVRGLDDLVVSDGSLFDTGTLGQLEVIPGWPGADVYPPQPMVSQTRAVLEAYRGNGGQFTEVAIEDSGHAPHIDQASQFQEAFFGFLGNSG